MSLKKWRNSSYRETIYLGRNQSEPEKQESKPNNNNNKWQWHKLWRKVNREKKKIFSAPVTLQASYDPDEYSKNFDHGTGWAEPDNLPRSFSARFSDPSMLMLTKNTSVRYARGV